LDVCSITTGINGICKNFNTYYRWCQLFKL